MYLASRLTPSIELLLSVLRPAPVFMDFFTSNNKLMRASLIWLSFTDHRLCFASLLDGRQVSCFGLGMVALDIRQESTRHTDALDAITTYLGLGSYKCRPRSCIRQRHLFKLIAFIFLGHT